MNDMVRLNVGGAHFTTTRSTLIARHPDSMLAAMLSPDNPMEAARTDERGAYFIDRNPKAFELILEYLRSGTYLDGLNVDPRMVQVEADYFGLQDLENEANSRLKGKDKVIYLNVGGTALTVSRETLLAAGPDSLFAPILDVENDTPIPRDRNGLAFIDCDPEEFKIVLNLLKTKQFPFELGPGVVEDLARRLNIGWMITMAKEFGPKRVVFVDGDNGSRIVQAGIIRYPDTQLSFDGKSVSNGNFYSYDAIEDKAVYKGRIGPRAWDTPEKAISLVPGLESSSSFWTGDQRFLWNAGKPRFDLKILTWRVRYLQHDD